VISKHAHYGPTEFYSQVIDELMRYWDIKNLQPTYPHAREAQQKAIEHDARLARIAEREMKRRGKLITQEEAQDMESSLVRKEALPAIGK